MIRTRFTELFGLEHPIMSAPMAGHSGGTLAAAVSKSGALGSFGGMYPGKGVEWLKAEIGRARDETDHPICVGFITAFLPYAEELFDATIEEQPAAVALSFGDPQPWAGRVLAAGARLICQVQTLEDAAAAVDAGADVLAAQGAESGGHTGQMGLLPLLDAVLDRHPDMPVLAAGGIASGRSLAAVLAAGADGAWIGTSFLATREAVEVPQDYQDLIVASRGDDTVLTKVYDVASGLPWPADVVDRVRRNEFVDEWDHKRDDLRTRRTVDPAAVAALAEPPEFDPARSAVRYGQGAGAVRAVVSAGDLVRSLAGDAEARLQASRSH